MNAYFQTTLFHQEALDAYVGYRNDGDVVRISPRWSDWAYRMIVIFVLIAIGYAALANMSRYSSGPAVVRLANRASVTAHVSAIVAGVEVAAGQRVNMGARLARFYDAEQRATVELLERAFATQLRNRLLEPSNQAAEQAVRALRVDLDRARAALADRAVIARRSGVIHDVRVRAGQHVKPGDVLMTIVDDDSALYIEALLPGGVRPQLAPGMELRLEMMGYRYAYQTLAIESVGTEVIGPSEARRYLGPQIGDAVTLSGPVVLVRAPLPNHKFEADGRWYHYHDGMQASAEVRLRSQRIWTLLVPGMEH